MLAAALEALPLISAGITALPALMQGRPLEALASGGLAYAGGRFLGGLPGKPGVYGAAVPGTGGKTVVGLARQAGQGLGLKPSQVLGLTALGTGAAVLPQLARAVGQPTAAAVRGAVGIPASAIPAMMGGIPGGPAQYDLSGLPPGVDPTFGYGSPYGTPYQMVDPTGQAAGARIGAEKMAESELKIMRRLNEERFKAAEARSKTEEQRQLLAANVRQNIATAAEQLLSAQRTAQDMGKTASQQMGEALTRQYQYQ
jgi:hypothetical protein